MLHIMNFLRCRPLDRLTEQCRAPPRLVGSPVTVEGRASYAEVCLSQVLG